MVNNTSKIEYRYDDDSLLTYVSFVSEPPINVEYKEFDGLKRVSKVSHSNTYETYRYTMLSNNSKEKHYSVDINKGKKGSKDTRHFRHEFNEALNNGGYVFTKRIRRYHNGNLFFDQVNKGHGIIESLIRSNGKIKYTYNKQRRVTREESSFEIRTYSYNNENKMVYYHMQPKDKSRAAIWRRYRYSNNELIHAENNEGKVLSLQYNKSGDIITLHMNKKTMNFVYNNYGKIKRINIQGVGALNITYDIHGSQKLTKSEPDDRKVVEIISELYGEMRTILSKTSTAFLL